MQLYILRHGEAGKGPTLGSRDALTAAGREEVQQIARGFPALGIKLDLIATSPLKRAYQTAVIIAKELNVKKSKLEEWSELTPEGERQELYRKISRFKQEASIMVIGHEPYLSTMISEVIFGSETDIGSIVLRKAGLAKLDIISFSPKIKGSLKWLLTAKQLKKLATK